jgi:hypothetical protein
MIANPIFDLMLRFDSEGRHALSADELRATNWYLPCLGFGGLCLIWMCLSKGGALPRELGMASFLLCFAVSQVFEATYTAFSDDLRNWLEKRRPDEG